MLQMRLAAALHDLAMGGGTEVAARLAAALLPESAPPLPDPPLPAAAASPHSRQDSAASLGAHGCSGTTGLTSQARSVPGSSSGGKDGSGTGDLRGSIAAAEARLGRRHKTGEWVAQTAPPEGPPGSPWHSASGGGVRGAIPREGVLATGPPASGSGRRAQRPRSMARRKPAPQPTPASGAAPPPEAGEAPTALAGPLGFEGSTALQAAVALLREHGRSATPQAHRPPSAGAAKVRSRSMIRQGQPLPAPDFSCLLAKSWRVALDPLSMLCHTGCAARNAIHMTRAPTLHMKSGHSVHTSLSCKLAAAAERAALGHGRQARGAGGPLRNPRLRAAAVLEHRRPRRRRRYRWRRRRLCRYQPPAGGQHPGGVPGTAAGAQAAPGGGDSGRRGNDGCFTGAGIRV